jgi:hypothetical protein
MRKSPEERKAALERQIAAKKQIIRRIEKRETEAQRRARNHRLIIAGAIAVDDALAHPDSEFARAYGRLLAQQVEAKDRPLFAELFRALMPADEAARLLGDAAVTRPAAK